MAISSLSLALSFFLLTLLAIASAGDYSDASSKYGFDGIPTDSPQAAKPEEAEKPRYDTKSDDYTSKSVYKVKQEEKEKSNYGSKQYTYKPKPEGEEKLNYDTKQDNYKPKPEGEEKPNYDTKQDTYKPKPEGEEKPNYDTKQNTYKPKSEEKEKFDDSEKPYNVKTKPKGGEKPNYDSKQDTYKPKPEEKEKVEYNKNTYVVKPEPKVYEKPSYGTTKPEEMRNRLSIAVQGLVLCKTSSNYYPIQGASATITCKAVDEAGIEKTISTCSEATDAKGYFFATLPGGDKLRLKECKAYLKSSPLETCNVATNVNKAIEGALLSAFRVLNDKKSKLYSVGPFFYTSSPEAKPTPKYGY